MVTHLVGLPGLESAVSKDSIAPLVFFSFFTRASTACKKNAISGLVRMGGVRYRAPYYAKKGKKWKTNIQV